MNFLRRGSSGPSDAPSGASDTVVDEDGDGRESVAVGGARTAPKGRPTPSRRQAQGPRRGPVAPPPRTQREALKRSKEQRGSREDRRKASSDRRARMMAGDDRVLPTRERGPVRAYVRDLVDSRRHFMGLLMPMAVLVFATILVPSQQIQGLGTTVCLCMLVAMIVEGTLLGRMVVGRARAKFPDLQIGGLSIGWYAATRASQIRKLRMPSPRVARGATVD